MKAAGRLASPIDTWYMWCAPHDPPGGVYLFTAPGPEGPWTAANGGAAVLPTSAFNNTPTIGSPNHVSSPYITWDPDAGKFIGWVHCGNFSTGPAGYQALFEVESADGITWTKGNGGNPVIAPDTGTSLYDNKYVAYLQAVRDGAIYRGFFQGATTDSPEKTRAIEATSPDGITWTKLNGMGRLAAFPPVEHGTDATNDYNPAILKLDDAGSIAVYFTDGPDGVRNTWVRVRAADQPGWTYPVPGGLELGPDGTWDDSMIVINEFVLDGGRLWCFFWATADVATTTGSAIGVASVPWDGYFDTSRGKG